MDSSAEKIEEPDEAHDLNQRVGVYQSVLSRGSVGWQTERPFVKTLGVGGQGTVLLAERKGAGSFRMPVALKFFSPAQFRSVAKYEFEMLRLTEVASMVARIQDDHLVDVHTFIENAGIFYLEMEWIDGFDLLHILRRDTLEIVHDAVTERRWERLNQDIVTTGEVDCRLKPGLAVAILRECLSGVSALHREGIIHCDLKPSNVMVKRSGQVKLIDIGSAFWTGRPPEGQPCTLEYAAPEILVGGRATPQSDLASLGYMLLEMLTGSKPFAGLQFGELIEAKRGIMERLPSMLPPDAFPYSESLIVLMRKLLDPDPARRFATAEEAELSDHGAAGFLRELVLGEMSHEYASELRRWIAEMETESMEHAAPSDHSIPGGTTRLEPHIEPPTQILPFEASRPDDDTGGFELSE